MYFLRPSLFTTSSVLVWSCLFTGHRFGKETMSTFSSTHHCPGATKPRHVSRIEVEPLIGRFGSQNPLRPRIPTNKYPAIKAPRTVLWGCVWSRPALETVQMMSWIHKKLEWASNNRPSLLSTCGRPGWEALATTTLLTHEEDPVSGCLITASNQDSRSRSPNRLPVH